MKRILTLDYLRGLAIFCMCIVHIWLNVFDTTSIRDFNFENFNVILLILGGILFIMGHFRSFFLMISAIGHQYTMENALKRGKSPEGILKRKLIGGGLMYALGVFREGILNPWGILDNLFYGGSINWNELTMAYYFETLQMIGIGTILLALLQYLLWKVQPCGNLKREMGVFAMVATVFIFISPIIHNAVDAHFGFDMETQFQNNLTTVGSYIGRFFWVMLAAKEEPIFPFFATVLIGAIVGKMLATPNISKKQLNFGHGVASGLIMLGAGWWILIDKLDFNLWFHIHPTWFFLVNTGVQLNLIFLFFRRHEFNPKIDHRKWLKRTRFFRKWGMVSLTIYMLQIIEMIPRWLCSLVLPVDCFHRGNLNWNWTLSMIIICMVFYELVLMGWEKLQFIGTWEWWVMLIRKKRILPTPNSSQKGTKWKDSVQMTQYLDKVSPIQFIPAKSLNLTI